MKNLRYLFFLLITLVIFWSCSDFENFDDPVDTERELALPLFHTTTSLTDLLDGFSDETFVTVGPDDLITLNYKGDVTERVASELFDFIDAIVVQVKDSVTIFNYGLPGTLDVTLMSIQTGLMGIQFENSFDEKIDLTVNIPELTLNGVPFSKSTELDAVSTNNNEWLTFIGLSGYDLQSNTDELTITYEAIKQSDGTRVVFDSTTTLQGIGITNLTFSYIEGFWGTEPLDLALDTIEIEFFENWVQGDVFFEDPTIEIAVDNAFGFPVRSDVKLLDIITVDGSQISLESQFIDNGIDFEYPAIDEVGEVKTTIFDFSKENSNVVEVLSSSPVSVAYDVDALANADSVLQLGFMTDTSFFKVQVSVELPFRGRVNNFKARDVFNVNFDTYDEVEYVEFKMIADNEIPLGIDVQLYFADENENVIDSLYLNSQNILNPAPVDANGEATGDVTETITFSTIDAAKFDKIRSAKKLIVEGSFFTTNASAANPSIVNLKSDQEVNIRMGMKVGTK